MSNNPKTHCSDLLWPHRWIPCAASTHFLQHSTKPEQSCFLQLRNLHLAHRRVLLTLTRHRVGIAFLTAPFRTQTAAQLLRAPKKKMKPAAVRVSSASALFYAGRKLPRVPLCTKYTQVQENTMLWFMKYVISSLGNKDVHTAVCTPGFTTGSAASIKRNRD